LIKVHWQFASISLPMQLHERYAVTPARSQAGSRHQACHQVANEQHTSAAWVRCIECSRLLATATVDGQLLPSLPSSDLVDAATQTTALQNAGQQALTRSLFPGVVQGTGHGLTAQRFVNPLCNFCLESLLKRTHVRGEAHKVAT